MSTGLFNLRKAMNVFGASFDESNKIDLPGFARSTSDNRALKSWSLQEMPLVGEKVGFMAKPTQPIAVAVFVTKGGVLKSTLTLNLARMAALHNIKTCVVGLDMQSDISTALSTDEVLSDEASAESDSLQDAIERMNSLQGLADVFTGEAKLSEVVRETDIPTLFYIPETPELVALDQSLINRNRREYWLSENVITPLKGQFDLIIMDCSPNWNRLITNALISCDTLISPVECKINNFRNLQMFRALISEFKSEMRAEFSHVYVPTRLATGRKLSQEIFQWYQENLPGCTSLAVRESIQGEESMAVRSSIAEYAPTTPAAHEMRDLISELWQTLCDPKRVRASYSVAKRAADVSV